jgi:hypothetical protein
MAISPALLLLPMEREVLGRKIRLQREKKLATGRDVQPKPLLVDNLGHRHW